MNSTSPKVTRKWPLSVSSQLIAIPAMRAASLMSELARQGSPVGRDGSGKLVEVYPAASLITWGFRGDGYKKSKGKAARRELVGQVLKRVGEWLTVPPSISELCIDSDDVFDALIASLAARAAAVGWCEPIPDDSRDAARREGWIQLPRHGSLPKLCQPVISAQV